MFNTLIPIGQRPLLVRMLIRFAIAVGSLTCTAPGGITSQPTYEEVEKFMAELEQSSGGPKQKTVGKDAEKKQGPS